MTDSTGAVKGEQSFDAWGRERNYKDWSKDTITQPAGSPFESINSLYGYGNNAGWITRGYTGHEHLPQFDLINMNGRLYDPVVGRMLSPDNNVADAGSTQAYNKYSYVNNNPLKYTDPSGWLLADALPDRPFETENSSNGSSTSGTTTTSGGYWDPAMGFSSMFNIVANNYGTLAAMGAYENGMINTINIAITKASNGNSEVEGITRVENWTDYYTKTKTATYYDYSKLNSTRPWQVL